MPDVASSVIQSVDHDGKAGLLVTFVSGQTYVYQGVSRGLYRRLLAASSKGAFFNDEIRDAFPFWQINIDAAKR